jgi:hypothetical protein
MKMLKCHIYRGCGGRRLCEWHELKCISEKE